MFFITKFMIILTLIILSSFFSMAEIALAATKKSKLRVLIEENQVNALKILKLQETPGDYFTVIQIGLNAVAILGGIVGEGILSPYITNLLKDYTHIGVATIETISFLFSFIFVTSFFIEFADLIPKRLAMAYPEKISLKLVNIMIVLMKIFKPVIWIFNGIANTVFKIFKLPITKKEVITSEEIIAVFNEGAEAGVVLEREHYLIENVFELEHRWVSSAMTARDNIIYFLLTETEEEIKEKIAENPHSKFLVCEREIDSIYGYVDAKDILPRILKGEKSGLQNIREITKKSLLIIPNTLTLSEVLDRFNESREDFAIILNEYAHVVGLITLSDVISTLMGDIVYPSQEEYIIKRGENSWLIDGLTPIEDVKKALNIERFPEEDSYETVGGFMMYMLKTIPKKAATLVFEGYTFEVVDVDNFKVDQLLVTKH